MEEEKEKNKRFRVIEKKPCDLRKKLVKKCLLERKLRKKLGGVKEKDVEK